MPIPVSTLDPDSVGPKQLLPLEEALKQCYDVSVDSYWVYCEETQRLKSMSPQYQQTYEYGGGIRIVYEKGRIYTAMSVELSKKSYVDAYNRAMSIIKR